MPMGFYNKPILFSLFSLFSKYGLFFGNNLANGVGQYSEMSWRASQSVPAIFADKLKEVTPEASTPGRDENWKSNRNV